MSSSSINAIWSTEGQSIIRLNQFHDDARMSITNKTRIRALVSALPGVHLRQIQRILRLSFSSVRYNVDALKKTREVLDRTENGRSCLFPANVEAREMIVYYHLRNRSSRKILRAFVQKEKLTNRELIEITGYAKSTLSESIHRLLETEIVTTSFSLDGKVAYQLRDPALVIPMIRAADQTVLEEATDRFIQLWDF